MLWIELLKDELPDLQFDGVENKNLEKKKKRTKKICFYQKQVSAIKGTTTHVL